MAFDTEAAPYLRRVRFLVQRYLLIHYPWHGLAEGKASADKDGAFLLKYFANEHISDDKRAAFERMTAMLADDPGPPPDFSPVAARFQELAAQFALDRTACDLLWLLLAPQLDPHLAWLLRLVARTRQASGLDTEVLWNLLDPLGQNPGPVRRALLPSATLLGEALLAVHEPAAAGRPAVLGAETRLADYLLGDDGLDRTLPDSVRLHPLAPDDAGAEALRRAATDQPDVLRRLHDVLRQRRAPLLVGRDRNANLRLIQAVSAPLGQRLLLFRPGPGGFAREAPLLRRLVREARLLNLALVCEWEAADPPGDAEVERLAEAQRRLGRLFLMTATLPDGPTLGAVADALQAAIVEAALPSADDRLRIWRDRLGPRDIATTGDDLLARVRVYPLGPSHIDRAVRMAEFFSEADPNRPGGLREDAVLRACRLMTQSALGSMAVRVNVTGRWDDLVLPRELLDKVSEIRAFAQHYRRIAVSWGLARGVDYGLGLTVLFSGESGTGKTMTAGLLARDLGIEIYRVDSSRIVSKYIGETEKQLDQVFELADRAGLALLFDEADAIFGKRTDIKSSTDRYANLETNYLLQKMEEFNGVVFLTTNFRQALDEAFLRRIKYKVDFPAPDAPARTELWRKMVMNRMPLDPAGIDFADLAHEFELTGGQIRNAVLRAALAAASHDRLVDYAVLRSAAVTECKELGKVVRD